VQCAARQSEFSRSTASAPAGIATGSAKLSSISLSGGGLLEVGTSFSWRLSFHFFVNFARGYIVPASPFSDLCSNCSSAVRLHAEATYPRAHRAIFFRCAQALAQAASELGSSFLSRTADLEPGVPYLRGAIAGFIGTFTVEEAGTLAAAFGANIVIG